MDNIFNSVIKRNIRREIGKIYKVLAKEDIQMAFKHVHYHLTHC